jgi:hypothetical protein
VTPTPTPDAPQPEELARLWILWGALFPAPLVVAVTCRFVAPNLHAPALEEPLLGEGLIAAAVLLELVALAWSPLVLARRPGPESPRVRELRARLLSGGTAGEMTALVRGLVLPFQALALAGWSLGEGGAVLAAISQLFRGTGEWPLLPLVLFAIQWLATAPRAARVRKFAAMHFQAAGLTAAQAEEASRSLR